MYDSPKYKFDKKTNTLSRKSLNYEDLYHEEDPENPFGVYKPWK